MSSAAQSGSNLDEPGGIGSNLIGASIAMMVLTTIAVVLRFWSRHLAKRAGYWLDDWLILAAWVILMVFFSIVLVMVHNGLGSHVGRVSSHRLSNMSLDIYVGEIFYNCGLTLVKLSVISFYVRIFTLRTFWFRATVYLTVFLCLAWVFAISFLACFRCSPIAAGYNPTIKGHCIPFYHVLLATSIPNVAIDVIILSMPIPLLWNISTDMRRRLGLMVVFALGYAVLALSIARLIIVLRVGNGVAVDVTYDEAPTGIITTLETGLGLVGACIPAMLHLFNIGIRSGLPRNLCSSASSISLRGKKGAHITTHANPIDPEYRQRTNYEQLHLEELQPDPKHSSASETQYENDNDSNNHDNQQSQVES